MLLFRKAVHTSIMHGAHNINIGHGHSLLNIVTIIMCK